MKNTTKFNKRFLKIILILSLTVFLCSCAPKVSVLPEEVKSMEEFNKNREEFYRKAFEEGKNACKKEIFSALQNEISRMKDLIEYEKLIKGGFITPPKVAQVIVPPEVSEDGKKVRAPYVEWIILEDAKFETKSLIERILSQKYYVLLGMFSTLSDADIMRDTVSKSVEKEKNVIVKVVQTTNNNYAVVLETSSMELAEKYEKQFKGQILK